MITSIGTIGMQAANGLGAVSSATASVDSALALQPMPEPSFAKEAAGATIGLNRFRPSSLGPVAMASAAGVATLMQSSAAMAMSLNEMYYTEWEAGFMAGKVEMGALVGGMALFSFLVRCLNFKRLMHKLDPIMKEHLAQKKIWETRAADNLLSLPVKGEAQDAQAKLLDIVREASIILKAWNGREGEMLEKVWATTGIFSWGIVKKTAASVSENFAYLDKDVERALMIRGLSIRPQDGMESSPDLDALEAKYVGILRELRSLLSQATTVKASAGGAV